MALKCHYFVPNWQYLRHYGKLLLPGYFPSNDSVVTETFRSSLQLFVIDKSECTMREFSNTVLSVFKIGWFKNLSYSIIQIQTKG